MPAQIARTGVLSGRNKRKRRRAAGDLGQDPGEMATAGALPALVRWGPGGRRGGRRAARTSCEGGHLRPGRGSREFWSGAGGNAVPEVPVVPGRGSQWAAEEWGLWLDWDTDSPSPTFPAQMAAPALLAGGNMGTGVGSLNLICEGIEEGVVKRRGGVGGAALTSGGAEGLTALMTTRMGSRSGVWTMRMKKWAPSMPPGPSCLSRYLRGGERETFLRGWWEPALRGSSHSTLFSSAVHLPVISPNLCRRAPRSPFLRSRSLTSRVWRKRRKSLPKGWTRRGLRRVSLRGRARRTPAASSEQGPRATWREAGADTVWGGACKQQGCVQKAKGQIKIKAESK